MSTLYARCAAVLCAVAIFGIVAPAQAATTVQCATPSDLCTGDPCTTVPATVAPTCALDFGDRALVIAAPLVVPDGGNLTLRARAARSPFPAQR